MAALLLVPFFLIRFGLLAALDKTAIARAAHFAPMRGGEMVACVVYQLANIAIMVYLFFLRVAFAPPALFWAGVLVYLAGNILLCLAMVGFAAPSEKGINRRGLYRVSRNPIYLAYFVFFMGCALLTQSLGFLLLVLLFQISTHWIILAEERWCLQNFGEEYRQYMRETRRYL